MKMKQCTACGFYTMKEECPKCNKPAKEAHYKFVRVKNAEKTDENEKN